MTKPTWTSEKALKAIQKQLEAGNDLAANARVQKGTNAIDVWIDTTQEVLARALGFDHPQTKDFRSVNLSEVNWSLSGRSGPGTVAERGMKSRLKVLQSAMAVVKLDFDDDDEADPDNKVYRSAVAAADIFLVHGHDSALRAEVELFLDRITGRRPVVLRDQPNGA